MSTTFDIEHTVTADDTDYARNVFFADFLKWQGHSRDRFLMRYAPDFLEELNSARTVITTRCQCEYFLAVTVADTVSIRLSIPTVYFNLAILRFAYHLLDPDNNDPLVARGEQQVACVRRDENETVPTSWPREVLRAAEDLGGDVSRAFVD
ncbi:enediyne biosynthesis thioesterase [Actinopolyspora alba]|uniref:Enediyne biosynthesis thioesterase n=1 Tax=Actinopolyspora alba TaxID=673379 RepID=A0A1I1WVW6_9ACTN|nr:thioesterase family protein [Actinopolyspora alba]SFD99189.1 enediyne biosynthesis thioesterase [Actinopolyspora alba]